MTPLLTGDAASRAREIVADVAAALRDPAVYDADPGLRAEDVGRGCAGAAVLYAELHAENGAEADRDTALEFLDKALEQAVEAERPSALLYPGTVGVGWVLAYLEGSLVDPDPDENDVDLLVAQALTTNWPSADLIRGVTGAGVYVLERGRPLDATVERLAAMSTTTDDGITWWVDPATCLEERRELFPEGYYDTGVAHGQAGTLALLAHALATGVEEARPLLAGGAEWLLAQRFPDGESTGLYPSLVPPNARAGSGTRVAWCYGDPGVAVGLLAAGRALDDAKLVDEAREVALAAAARRGRDAGVVDAPLCHGSVGLVHVFGRLYEQLGDESLADAARHWFGVALEQHRPGQPVAGWGSMRPEGDDLRYEPLAGFLEGATGVALALLAATSERAPDWDVLLLTKPVP
ncbi:MAG TPA: lanthionine synthetase C family protein [Frankiaceae bacterium]|nr:lanthionine synthetase C family protein [Frankiaceae bacterium]